MTARSRTPTNGNRLEDRGGRPSASLVSALPGFDFFYFRPKEKKIRGHWAIGKGPDKEGRRGSAFGKILADALFLR